MVFWHANLTLLVSAAQIKRSDFDKLSSAFSKTPLLDCSMKARKPMFQARFTICSDSIHHDDEMHFSDDNLDDIDALEHEVEDTKLQDWPVHDNCYDNKETYEDVAKQIASLDMKILKKVKAAKDMLFERKWYYAIDKFRDVLSHCNNNTTYHGIIYFYLAWCYLMGKFVTECNDIIDKHSSVICGDLSKLIRYLQDYANRNTDIEDQFTQTTIACLQVEISTMKKYKFWQADAQFIDSIGNPNPDNPFKLLETLPKSEIDVVEPKARDSAENEELAKKLAKIKYLEPLCKLEGLKKVKKMMMNLVNQQLLDKMRGGAPTVGNHMVFLGNPGTGKTTVARIVAKAFYHIGSITEDVFIETSGADLVRQGSDDFKKILDKCEHGVLFIDEVYQLNPKKDKVGESIANMLLTAMENARDTMVVIIAGYSRQVDDFLTSNPGFNSRFDTKVPFEDYTQSELYNIFCRMLNSIDPRYRYDNEQTVDIMAARLAKHGRKEGFGNARDVRKAIERAIKRQADRICKDNDFTACEETEMFTNTACEEEPTISSKSLPSRQTTGYNGYSSGAVEQPQVPQDFFELSLSKQKSLLNQWQPWFQQVSRLYSNSKTFSPAGAPKLPVDFPSSFWSGSLDMQTYILGKHAQTRKKKVTKVQTHQKNDSVDPSYYVIRREDLIGSISVDMNSSLFSGLRDMVGMQHVISQLNELIKLLIDNRIREELGTPTIDCVLHRLFVGNPGTGKTTVARVYARLLCLLGFVDSDEVIETTPQQLKGSVIGESEKNMNAIIDRAKGKVLFIDEAYCLGGNEGGNYKDPYSQGMIDTLIGRIHGEPHDPCVLLLAGYEDEMNNMLNNTNPGLKRRVGSNKPFYFKDYDTQSLLEILINAIHKQELHISFETADIVIKHIAKGRQEKNFGNAGVIISHLRSAATKLAARESTLNSISERSGVLLCEDFGVSAESMQKQLDSLKQDMFAEVREWVEKTEKLKHRLEIRAQPTNNLFEDRMTFVFTGAPGTGKTTAARQLGQILFSFGALANGKLFEKSASRLMTGYVGQAGLETLKALDEALGGVLFIDEAYRLAHEGYGKEVVNELVNALTDIKYKGKIAVILAGYEHQIHNLLDTNDGLQSRFTQRIHFNDFSPEKCSLIFHRFVEDSQILESVSSTCHEIQIFGDLIAKVSGWANARDVKNIVSYLESIANDDGIVTDTMLKEARDNMLSSRSKDLVSKNGEQIKIPNLAMTQSADCCAPPPPVMSTVCKSDMAPETKSEDVDSQEDINDMMAFAQQIEAIASELNVSPETLKSYLDRNDLPDEIWAKLAAVSSLSISEIKHIHKDDLNRLKKQVEKIAEKMKQEAKQRGVKMIRYCLVCGQTHCNFRPITIMIEDDS